MLLRARNENDRAIDFGKDVVDGNWIRLVIVSEQDFSEAWQVFQKFHDKEWSFTDCTSRVLMERLSIPQAFAFDEHFQQFGTVTVVP